MHSSIQCASEAELRAERFHQLKEVGGVEERYERANDPLARTRNQRLGDTSLIRRHVVVA